MAKKKNKQIEYQTFVWLLITASFIYTSGRSLIRTVDFGPLRTNIDIITEYAALFAALLSFLYFTYKAMIYRWKYLSLVLFLLLVGLFLNQL